MAFGMFWWPMMAGLGFLGGLIALLVLVFWIWMIIDCAKRNFFNSTEKIIWIIGIVIFGWVGALVYLLVIRMNNPKGVYKK